MNTGWSRKNQRWLLLHLQVRGPRVPQGVRDLELQAVPQGLSVWVDDVHDGSPVQVQLGEPLWDKAACRGQQQGTG